MKSTFFTLLLACGLFTGFAQSPLLFLTDRQICANQNISVRNIINDAASYAWYADGKLITTGKTPGVAFKDTGLHTVQLRITTHSNQYMLNNFKVKTACCWKFLEVDPTPSFYVIIKDTNGNTVYRSTSLGGLAPVDIPMTALLKANTNYTLELWDYDLIGSDDLLGSYAFNSDTPLHNLTGAASSVSFTCEKAAPVYEQTLTVQTYKPWITLTQDGALIANVPPYAAQTGSTYRWYHSINENQYGQIVESSTNNVYYPKTPGWYRVDVSYLYTCESERIAVGVVATKEAAWAVGVQVSPNPASDAFRVSFQEYANVPVDWRVFDMSGRLMTGGLLQQTAEIQVDCSRWTPGIYMLTLRREGGIARYKMVVRG